MKIKKKTRDLIIREIDYVISEMENLENKNLIDKLYYFSGISSTLNRVVNVIEYDEELLFVSFISQTLHQTFNQKTDGIQKGIEPLSRLTEEQVEKLMEYTKELKSAFEEDKSFYGIMLKFVSLTYSLTGNGFYMMKKGMLKLT